MKIAVYAIALNEEKFAHRFVDSVREADRIIVLDTGSTDETVKRLRDAGASAWDSRGLFENGFRFDVARNAALGMVPSDIDICVILDLDEVVRPGWREAIEEVWCDGVSSATATVIASDVSFSSVRAHSRNGWAWKYPVHNLLMPTGGAVGRQVTSAMTIDHLQQPRAERTGRMTLHQLSVAEYPSDPRPALYLTREYYYRGMWRECADEGMRYLSLSLSASRAPVERAAVMRWTAHASALAGGQDSLGLAMRACAEAPGEREPWVELAKMHYDAERWSDALSSITEALKITERPKHYLTEAFAWGDWPERIAWTCRVITREFDAPDSVVYTGE